MKLKDDDDDHSLALMEAIDHALDQAHESMTLAQVIGLFEMKIFKLKQAYAALPISDGPKGDPNG